MNVTGRDVAHFAIVYAPILGREVQTCEQFLDIGEIHLPLGHRGLPFRLVPRQLHAIKYSYGNLPVKGYMGQLTR
jgi:hypothetical protein